MHDWLPAVREDFMKKPIENRNHHNMWPEYVFASMKGGVGGKYYEKYRKGTNVVRLKPDVAEAFLTKEAVNEALWHSQHDTRGATDWRSA